MRKIPTLFLRDPDDMRHVTREVHPECRWVLDGEGHATRKFDGACTMLDDDGQWWARREVKPGKTAPPNWVQIDHDEATGKSVGWEPIAQSPRHSTFLAVAVLPTRPGTYELCGPKVDRNPEGYTEHTLIPHGLFSVEDAPRDFDGLTAWLADTQYEGIVWHHQDGRRAKLKKRDFAA